MGKIDEIQELCKQFDEATINNDGQKLASLIDEIEKDIENHDVLYKAALYYSLATATFNLWKIEHKDCDCGCDQESIQKQLYFYRKAIDLFEDDSFREESENGYIISLMANTYINYGNTLEACGRKLLAIEQYYRALSIYPDHPMALGNLGSSLLHYSMFLPNNKGYVRDCINYYAVHLLEKAVSSEDQNIFDDAREFFIARLNSLATEYREFLHKDIEFCSVSRMSKKEQSYREWCIDLGLFITPLSDLPCDNQSFAIDDMCLPELLTPVHEEIPIVIGMFNQLKQEYISARYTYYETLDLSNKPHFSDKKTAIIDTLEYAQFSLRVEKLKTSFKTLYGILDKVAYFLNAYFNLGIKPKAVNFTNVWKRIRKLDKNGTEYECALDTSSNFALSALYWIQREFEKSEDRYASPKLRKLKEIRNFLEHKYTIVTMFPNEALKHAADEVALYITEQELSELTLELMKLVREAIICIALCVNVEEMERYKQLKLNKDNLLTIPMFVRELDDEFKI